VTTQVT